MIRPLRLLLCIRMHLRKTSRASLTSGRGSIISLQHLAIGDISTKQWHKIRRRNQMQKSRCSWHKIRKGKQLKKCNLGARDMGECYDWPSLVQVVELPLFFIKELLRRNMNDWSFFIVFTLRHLFMLKSCLLNTLEAVRRKPLLIEPGYHT